MMPLAPTSTELPTAQKPKIGFSIDSIVGGSEVEAGKERKENNNSTSSPFKSYQRSRRNSQPDNEVRIYKRSSPTRSPEPSSTDLSERGHRSSSDPPMTPHHKIFIKSENGTGSPSMPNGHFNLTHPTLPLSLAHHGRTGNNLFDERRSRSPPPKTTATSPASIITRKEEDSSEGNGRVESSTSPNGNNRSSTSSVGSVRSRSRSPISPPPPRSESRKSSPSHSPLPRPIGIPASAVPISPHEISHGPPFPRPPGLSPGGPMGPHGLPSFGGYPPGMINFAAAAAAAAAARVQHHHPHPGLPGWMPPPHHHPHHAASAHPLYPWLLAKHGRLFPHRFGPGPDLPGFLLQPFRKPKRIRTAFSPSQLLKLEHAFERNHYVVGAERKQLANSLSLSETQVKVWFQNRRTKHKRMQQEEESSKKSGGGGGGGVNGSGSSHSSSAISADSSTRNYAEEMSDDEEIVMDEEYSDEEVMERMQRH